MAGAETIRAAAARSWKPVVTLSEEELREAVLQLWQMATSGHARPDLVVGIATGGLVCAQYLQGLVPVLPVTLRRAGTATKRRSLVTGLLRHTPYAITDLLRRVEDFALDRRQRKGGGAGVGTLLSEQFARDVAAIAAFVRERGARRVLVMDDAIDSGATLGRVLSAVKDALPPDVAVSTAVVTHTRATTAVRADVALYEDVLCRFPWSFDYRGS